MPENKNFNCFQNENLRNINIMKLIEDYYSVFSHSNEEPEHTKLTQLKQEISNLRSSEDKMISDCKKLENLRLKLTMYKQKIGKDIENESKIVEKISTLKLCEINEYDKLKLTFIGQSKIEDKSIIDERDINFNKYIKKESLNTSIVNLNYTQNQFTEKEIKDKIESLKESYEIKSNIYKNIIKRLREKLSISGKQ
jgi:hypothetical protein